MDANNPGVPNSRRRVWLALAVVVAANAELLLRGPGKALAGSLLLLVAAGGGLAWFAWEQRERPLVGRRVVLVASVGLLALAVVRPPTESHDVWSYVMIGRTVAVHHSDPYQHPSSAFRDDPFRLRVDPVWRHARSVYGPAFVGLAALAVKVAGDSPTGSRVAFQGLAALAVILCMIVIDRVTRGDPRALAFVGLNVLVVVTTVNNAHNDALVGLAALGGVLLAKRRPAMAGALLGAAALVKIAAVLPAGVLALWLFRDGVRRAAITFGAAVGAVTGLGYLAAGSASLTVLRSASDRINRGTPWFPIREGLVRLQEGAHPSAKVLAAARASIGPRLSMLSTVAVLSFAVFVALRARREPTVIVGAAVIGYVVLAAYIFPWYMVWCLPVVALMWRSRIAWLAVGIALANEMAYVPDTRPIGLLKQPPVQSLLQRMQLDFRTFALPLLSLVALAALLRWLSGGARRIQLDGGASEAGADTPPGDEDERLDDGAPRQLGVTGGPIGEDDRDLADRSID